MEIHHVCFPEEIPSDEDEVGQKGVALQSSGAPTGNDNEDEDEDDDDDEYWDDEGLDGTPLEEYSTPLDYDNGEDEYQFFTASLLRMHIFLLYNIPHTYICIIHLLHICHTMPYLHRTDPPTVKSNLSKILLHIDEF